MENEALEKILALYKSIKDVEFEGRFEKEDEIEYDDGPSTTRYLVAVYSDNIRRVMKEIWDIDSGDQIWKGITGNTFWAWKIEGDYNHDRSIYKIIEVGHATKLKWRNGGMMLSLK
uniref:Uncharacterized protein n=1 Tax=Amphimedon queenslandica TaxID=400682 RepID=A0A1X7VQL5_AMPQE